MREACYLIGAKRSPVTPRDGALSTLSLHELSTPVINALLIAARVDPLSVDEVIVGNALGAGGNPARVISLAAGLSERVAGLSIDRQCCSGLDAVLLAKDMVTSGRASIVIAGGVESYSQRPLRFRVGKDSSEPQAYDQPPFTPWPDRDPDMGLAADQLASELDINFQMQNDWAMKSHAKALSAKQTLHNEIVAVGGIEHDSFTRKLSPAVCTRAKRLHGNITAANTAVAADASAFCLVVSESIAKQFHGLKLRIASGITLGANPELPGLAPVAAIKSVLNSEGLSAAELARAEIMEAYAAQAIACIQQTGIDEAICNMGGGALARGHPIGASGAVLLTRLYSEMSHVQGFGIAAIAAAGGLGTALLLERFEP